MRELRVVGRVAAEVLPEYSRLWAAVPPAPGVYYVFACRQQADLPLTTRFRDASGHAIDLLAVTQQYNQLWDEIPHGWNVVLALQAPPAVVTELAGLPFVADWYARDYTDLLVLSVLA